MSFYISNKMRELKPSAIREIFKYATDPEVISLAAGDPAPESLPVEVIQNLLENLLDDNPESALLYSQSEGHPPLREKVKDFVWEMYGINTDNDDVMIVSGAQQVMDLTTKVLVDEGDSVITEQPSFIGALNAFRSYGANLVGVPMDDNGMIPEELEKAIEKSPDPRFIYVIPNFNNPSGTMLSLERRKEIYRIACRNNLVILEDNPYGDLRFSGEDIPSIKTMDTEGRVIYAGTFSKILSTGIRVGYMIAPKEIFPKLTVAKQCTDVHTNMLGQLLCLEFLNTQDMNIHLENLTKIYKNKAEIMLREIERNFPKEATWTVPQGGLFVWCTLPNGIDADDFAKRLVKEKKVCVVPGSAFNVDGGKSSNIRLNYSMPSEQDIVKGVRATAELIKEYLTGGNRNGTGQ